MKINYPVVFFLFKRPATTQQFLTKFAAAGVSKIYIFADGPRSGSDKLVTDAVRAKVESFIADHPELTIITNYSSTNIGLKQNIINGLTKVFKSEDAAIIVEDDCLPHDDFFPFCAEMLKLYDSAPQVMSVSGTSSGGNSEFSYDFTRYPQCWGWATWARAWQLYDPALSSFDRESWNTIVREQRFNMVLSWYWYSILSLVKNGWIKTWDYQWSYAHFVNHGLAVSPSVNLIQNIGFDAVATNTKTKSKVANMQTNSLAWPLIAPPTITENISVSSKIASSFYQNPIAILGMLRQYFYWLWSHYVNRH